MHHEKSPKYEVNKELPQLTIPAPVTPNRKRKTPSEQHYNQMNIRKNLVQTSFVPEKPSERNSVDYEVPTETTKDHLQACHEWLSFLDEEDLQAIMDHWEANFGYTQGTRTSNVTQTCATGNKGGEGDVGTPDDLYDSDYDTDGEPNTLGSEDTSVHADLGLGDMNLDDIAAKDTDYGESDDLESIDSEDEGGNTHRAREQIFNRVADMQPSS